MKRVLFLCAAVAIFVTLFASSFSAIEYVHSSNAPIIDGVVDDLWYDHPSLSVSNTIYGTTKIRADFRMIWNKTTLFLLVRVFDSNISHGAKDSEKDGVTLLINPSNSVTGDVYKIIITAPADSAVKVEGESVNVSEFERLFKKAYVKTDYGYMIEISCDITALYPDFTGVSGRCLGFDIWVTDQNFRLPMKDSVISWCGYTGLDDMPLKDTVAFMTVAMPDSPTPDDPEDEIPGTDDGGLLWQILAATSFAVITLLLLKKKNT